MLTATRGRTKRVEEMREDVPVGMERSRRLGKVRFVG